MTKNPGKQGDHRRLAAGKTDTGNGRVTHAENSSTAAPKLSQMIDGARQRLLTARDHAAYLDARDQAALAFTAAKAASRLARARGAHDELIANIHRVQADALEIEAAAKRRLADEYDAAQAAGEVASKSDGRRSSKAEDQKPTVEDLGLTHKQVHQARQIRDAEEARPGVVRDALDAKLEAGEEPTRTALQEAVLEAARIGMRPERRRAPRNPKRKGPDENPEFSAMVSLSGDCRNILRLSEEHEISFFLRGFYSDDDRARTLALIERCRNYLTELLEESGDFSGRQAP